VTSAQGLPIPEYDHLPAGSVEHRIKALDASELERLYEYERRHAARTPVLTVLETRLARVRSGEVEPTGAPQDVQPEQAPPPAGGSPVGPTDTGIHPHPHGEPAQPARPKGENPAT
jgi:hypothetical protein